MADLKLLEKLCLAQGAPGREDEVRELILASIRPHADDITVDPLGNVLVYKKGAHPAAQRVLLDAHMDEVAMMVTGITDDGLLYFSNLGGIDDRVLAGMAVQIGDKRIPGVTGIKPVHLCKDDEKDSAPGADDRYIDIGALDRADVEKHVSPGDVVFFSPYFEQIGGRIAAKALDDRAGCALLIELLRGETEYDLYASFSVQEEVGLRGAKTAAFTLKPDAAIALEATTAADIPGIPSQKQVCALGAGPAISFMDGRTIYDKSYYELALKRAKELGINAQPKRAVAGGNNAGAIHTTRGGVRTLAISLPCRYLHTATGMISIADYDDALALVRDLSARLASGQTE